MEGGDDGGGERGGKEGCWEGGRAKGRAGAFANDRGMHGVLCQMGAGVDAAAVAVNRALGVRYVLMCTIDR